MRLRHHGVDDRAERRGRSEPDKFTVEEIVSKVNLDYCPKCGTELDGETTECSHCGANLVDIALYIDENEADD